MESFQFRGHIGSILEEELYERIIDGMNKFYICTIVFSLYNNSDSSVFLNIPVL